MSYDDLLYDILNDLGVLILPAILLLFLFLVFLLEVHDNLYCLEKVKKENKEKYELLSLMVNFLYKNNLYKDKDEFKQSELKQHYLALNAEKKSDKWLYLVEGFVSTKENLEESYKKYKRVLLDEISYLEFEGNRLKKADLEEILDKFEHFNLYCETTLYLSFLLQNYYAIKVLNQHELAKEQYENYLLFKDKIEKETFNEKELKKKELACLNENHQIQINKLNSYIKSCLLERV